MSPLIEHLAVASRAGQLHHSKNYRPCSKFTLPYIFDTVGVDTLYLIKKMALKLPFDCLVSVFEFLPPKDLVPISLANRVSLTQL